MINKNLKTYLTYLSHLRRVQIVTEISLSVLPPKKSQPCCISDNFEVGRGPSGSHLCLLKISFQIIHELPAENYNGNILQNSSHLHVGKTGKTEGRGEAGCHEVQQKTQVPGVI